MISCDLSTLVLLVLMSGGETTLRNVKTKYGPIQGVLHQPADSLQPVATFLGIPFAAPPLGNLRFMPPVTVSPWKETLLADKFAPVCPQHLAELDNRTASSPVSQPGDWPLSGAVPASCRTSRRIVCI